MAHIKDLIVNGNSRTVGTAYATKFEGPLNGTATYANSAGSANTATTASTANAVTWANVSGKPSTYAPSSHTHGLVADSHAKTLPAQSEDLTWATNIASNSGFWLYSLRLQNIAPEWAVGGGYGAGIAFGGEDTKGVITLEYSSPTIRVAGGNGTAPVWHVDLVHSGNIGSQSVKYAASAGSANTVAWGNVTGKPSTYYTHPSYTAHGNGLYKVTVDGSGHVSAATTVTSADIRSLGIAGLTGESTLPSSYTGGDVWKAPS